MKKALHLLLFGLVVFSACYPGKQPLTETSLFRDFSLSLIIRNMQIPELQPQSGNDGESESFGDPVRRRRNSDVTFLLVNTPEAKFDDDKFLKQLGLEIEKAIAEAGLHVDSRSSSPETLQIDYSRPGYTGSLDVAASKAGTSQFKVWAVLREEARENAR